MVLPKVFASFVKRIAPLLVYISMCFACTDKLDITLDDICWYGKGSVKYSQPHGVYHESIQVLMKSDNGGIIHYTLNGNTPNHKQPCI